MIGRVRTILARWIGGEAKMTSLELFRELYGGRTSKAGVAVTWTTALEVTTVLACCRVIAEGIAQVPWRLFQETPTGRKKAVDHPLYDLIYRRPNRRQTSFEFRETIALHLTLCANAYVWVGRVGAAREIRELVPLEPSRVTVSEATPGGALQYDVRGSDGRVTRFGADQIWHLRGLSWNGWFGLEAIRYLRDAIGLASAIEAAQSEQHKGTNAGGVYSVDDNLSPAKFAELAAWIDKYAVGGERAGKPLILDLGAKFARTAFSAVDLQTIEARKHQVEEICRGFRVMPIMVGATDKTATYASAEQMFIAHVVHTLSPWYERIEQSGDLALLSDEDRRAGYYTKFTPAALMRGATKDRFEAYAKALGGPGNQGWMVPNDVRSLEEMDDLPDGGKLAVAGAAPATPTEGAA